MPGLGAFVVISAEALSGQAQVAPVSRGKLTTGLSAEKTLTKEPGDTEAAPSSLAVHVSCPNPFRRSSPWAVGHAPCHLERPSLAQGLSAQLGGWLCSEPRKGAGWPPFCPQSAELRGRASLSPHSHRTGDLSFPLSRDLVQHDKKVWLLWGKRLSLGAKECVCQRQA